MKTNRIFTLSMIVATAIFTTNCVTTDLVEVKSARTGTPIGGAAVVSVNGTIQSSPNYTDARGVAPVPALPVPVRKVVVTKAGYNSGTVTLPVVVP